MVGCVTFECFDVKQGDMLPIFLHHNNVAVSPFLCVVFFEFFRSQTARNAVDVKKGRNSAHFSARISWAVSPWL